MNNVIAVTQNINIPHLIELDAIGDDAIGYITVAQHSDKIPFELKRIFWTYQTPETVVRGKHAHKELQQVIVAVSGTVNLELENIQGEHYTFELDAPTKALYIPPMHWAGITLRNDTVLLSIASREYKEEDYIRSYDEFLRTGKN